MRDLSSVPRSQMRHRAVAHDSLPARNLLWHLKREPRAARSAQEEASDLSEQVDTSLQQHIHRLSKA